MSESVKSDDIHINTYERGPGPRLSHISIYIDLPQEAFQNLKPLALMQGLSVAQYLRTKIEGILTEEATND